MGATNCFVPSTLVKVNGWNVAECIACDVKLPSGQVLKSNKVCSLPVTLAPNFVIKVKFLVVPIETTFILRVTWLEKYGVLVNFSNKSFSLRSRRSSFVLPLNSSVANVYGTSLE